ncbi:HEPN domain-containing protein [Dehalococcoidia bacterium]|nr:HEPN domain-containing protein [Dehalococcoidia bacterium]MCL0077091.1 HEPN domain-containing protein [Dehalococcoidia bacterium]
MDKTRIALIISGRFKQSFSDVPGVKELLNSRGMVELISKPLLTQDTATQRLSLCFLVEAERDIASCNALYSKKLYPHAVYHLQQAVEKATKGYMLGFNWLSAQELRKIGHDTPKLSLDALFKETGIESWFKQGGDEVLETIINDMWQVMSNPDKRQEVARITYDEIMEWLSLILMYVNRSKVAVENVIEDMIECHSLPVGAEFPPPPIQAMVVAPIVLSVLGAVSFPHWEYTRYPDGKMVPSDYEANLGIVRAIPEIIKCLEPEIQQLKATMVAHGFGDSK